NGVPVGMSDVKSSLRGVAISLGILRSLGENLHRNAVLCRLQVAKGRGHPAVDVVVEAPSVAVRPAAVSALDEVLDVVVDSAGVEDLGVLEEAVNSPVGVGAPRVVAAFEAFPPVVIDGNESALLADGAVLEEGVHLPK